MDQVYQTEHLQFVSNNNGTSPVEIMLVGGPVHCSLLLLTGLSQWLGLDYSSFIGTILESAIAVLPPLLSPPQKFVVSPPQKVLVFSPPHEHLVVSQPPQAL